MTLVRTRPRYAKISGEDCVVCGPTQSPVYPVVISIGEDKGTLLLCDTCKDDVRVTVGGRTWRMDK